MRLFLASLLLAGSLACQGSDPQPLVFLEGDAFDPWDGSVASELAGGGAGGVVAYTRPGDAAGWSLRILRHDAAHPAALELLGDVPLETVPRAVWVSGTLVAADVDFAVTIVDAGDAALPLTSVAFSGVIDHVAVDDAWVLVATGSTVTLIDRAQPASRTTATAPAEVTALLATQGSFLAFTASGYMHVAPGETPTFDAVPDETIRGFRAAFADGAQAMVAGPAPAIGRSRVARLDLSDPAAPVLLRSHEVDGTFGSFAWDGGDTSIVGIVTHTDPYWEPTLGIEEGWVIHEANGAFTSVGTPLPGWRTVPATAAHAGHLFALSGDGFGFYRLER